jgi:hypothetical protein
MFLGGRESSVTDASVTYLEGTVMVETQCDYQVARLRSPLPNQFFLPYCYYSLDALRSFG